MNSKKTRTAIALIMGILLMGISSGHAASNLELEKRIATLEEQKESSAAGKSLWDRFTLSGAIELDYSGSGNEDVSDKTKNSSTSDLDIGTIELGLDANLHKYVTAFALLKGENLSSNDDKIFWDEVFFTIAGDNMPVYFTGGKRVQPFGRYESLFINDPITQDLYEINGTGATVGYTSADFFDIDLSFTLYKGETLINRVKDTGYGWERNNSPGYASSKTVNSYIVSAAISPVNGMDLAVFYNSEPGDSERNTTLGGSFHFEIADFITDIEYIGALNREKHAADDKEYRESAWVASLGYQIADPLLVAVRYEDFNADRSADGNLDHRYSIGMNYTLFENEDFSCNLLGEYRRGEYEGNNGSANDLKLNEFFARVALEF